MWSIPLSGTKFPAWLSTLNHGEENRKLLNHTEDKNVFTEERGCYEVTYELLCVCVHICIEFSPSQNAVSLAPLKQNFILYNILILFWNVEEHRHQLLSLALSYFYRKEIWQIIQETYNS